MYCINCGKELPENGKFCSECGAKVEINEAINNEAATDCEPITENSSVDDVTEANETRDCPHCGKGDINVGATMCKHCWEKIEPVKTATIKPTKRSVPHNRQQTYTKKYICQSCGLFTDEPYKQEGSGCLLWAGWIFLIVISMGWGLILLLIWLFINRNDENCCPNCKAKNALIPTASPRGWQLVEQYQKNKG